MCDLHKEHKLQDVKCTICW